MSKKDYILIAKVFNAYITDDLNLVTDQDKLVVRALSKALSIELEKENPRFDTNRFLEACGVAV